MMFQLASREITLLEELWKYVSEKYLTPQYGNYENITIDQDPLISPALIFVAVFVAVMTSSIIMIFNKRILGRLVRLLISQGAVGYENAKRLEEIGLNDSFIIRLFINRYTLRRAVRCCEEDDFYGIDPKYAPKLDPTIGIENTEKIKTPFWRRGKSAAQSQVNENPCYTKSESTFADESRYTEIEKSEQEICKCDADNSVAASDPVETEKEESTLIQAEDATKDAPRFKNAYDASVVAKKRYMRRINEDKFYILEAEAPRLRMRFDKKGTNPLWLVFMAIFCIAAGLLVIKFLPAILGQFDKLLSNFDRGY